MHKLLTLKADSKLTTAAKVDSLISAELPDPVLEPELYKIVSSTMLHRPCGDRNPASPCMQNGHCSKRYPKDFREETSLSVDSYPEYRRRDDGRTIECRGISMDNRSIVPYCPYLSLTFEAHINVEVCALIHAVKYLYKYVYKGPDRARIYVHRNSSDNEYDEIDTYRDTRYACAPEAAHRIFAFALTKRSDAVVRLQIHLPNFESVPFKISTQEETLDDEKKRLTVTVEAAEERMSTLTAVFALNKTCHETKIVK